MPTMANLGHSMLKHSSWTSIIAYCLIAQELHFDFLLKFGALQYSIFVFQSAAVSTAVSNEISSAPQAAASWWGLFGGYLESVASHAAASFDSRV